MQFLLICGAAAVGKMTVGQAVMEKTGLRLFHNHMMIEPVLEVFGDYEAKVIEELRETVFRHYLKSDRKGLIFTMIWAFDRPEDHAYVRHLSDLCAEYGAGFCIAELTADREARLERNRTENRLQNKPSKRDTENSEARLLAGEKKYRAVSRPGEVPYKRYIRIDNTNLSPEEAADRIIAAFGLASE